MRLKLIEVARRCGVHVSTVSRVMNNRPGVDPETRERILRVVAETQFDPESPILQRHQAEHPMLAFLVPEGMKDMGLKDHQVRLGEVDVIEAVAEAAGYGLFVGTYGGRQEPTAGDRMLRQRALAGAVIPRTRYEDLDFRELRDNGIPFVVLNRLPEPGNGIHSVCVDNVRTGRMAAEHLLQLGHRRIALLSGSMEIPTSAERAQGYREALRAAGLGQEEELVVTTDLTSDDARSATGTLLDSPNRPTAVIALNDYMAIAAMEVAQERGMAVPGDLAVLGSDDIEIAAYARPALSTVHVPWLEMTRVASQLLLEVIRTPELAEVKVRFETRLVIRESCGALARADAEGQGSRRERRSNRRA